MDKIQKKQVLDEHLFREEMQDVVPLETQPRSDSTVSRRLKDAARQNTNSVIERHSSALEPTDEKGGVYDDSSYRKNGVQSRLLQKLKRGRFPPGDQLDLHNMTLIAGHDILQDFIAGAREGNLRCVRIIHGKGLRSKSGPVLKQMVHQSLREHPAVLAFTVCKPADGGSGAVDVLLKTS